MSEVGKFTCASCNRSFTWKPELAGKRVKCKCGEALSVPRTDPAEEQAPPGLEDLHALADGQVDNDPPPPPVAGLACPSCGAGVESGAVLCVSCGYNLKTRKKLSTSQDTGGGVGAPALAGAGASAAAGVLAYAGRRSRVSQEERERTEQMWSPVKDMYIPIAVIIVGTILTFFEVMYYKGVSDFATATLVVGVLTLVNVALVFAGVMITVRLLDLGLGALPTALLKIAGIAILPGAVGNLLEMWIFTAGFLGWGVSLLLTFALFMWLLELDGFETCICSTIIWLVRTWLGYLIVGVLLASAFRGVGGSGGGGVIASAGGSAIFGGDGGPSAGSATLTAKDFDDEARPRYNSPGAHEARKWLAADANRRLVLGETHEEAVALIEKLYTLGAKDVRIIDPLNDKGDVFVILLPTEKAKRKSLFEWEAKVLEMDEMTPDVGQTMLMLDLNPNAR